MCCIYTVQHLFDLLEVDLVTIYAGVVILRLINSAYYVVLMRLCKLAHRLDLEGHFHRLPHYRLLSP